MAYADDGNSNSTAGIQATYESVLNEANMEGSSDTLGSINSGDIQASIDAGKPVIYASGYRGGWHARFVYGYECTHVESFTYMNGSLTSYRFSKSLTKLYSIDPRNPSKSSVIKLRNLPCISVAIN